MTREDIWWLGFGVAAAHAFHLRPHEGVLLAQIARTAPNLFSADRMPSTRNPGEFVARRAVHIHACRLREAVADCGLNIEITSHHQRHDRPGGYSMSRTDADTLAAFLEGNTPEARAA